MKCFKFRKMECNKNRTVKSDNFAKFSNVHCTVGIDEAGRGPVLGPMVYGIGICATEELERLKELGVADSKVLTELKRDEIFAKAQQDDFVNFFAYAVEILSPYYISVSMLKRAKYNLNEISHDTAIMLVELCLKEGMLIDKIYVDTVGPPESYQKKLEDKFPRIEICVSKKADSLFPIVSAASICAKVTRDKVLAEWICKEFDVPIPYGSGYPADPATKSFMEKSLDPVFGYPTLVRFSWSTAQEIMDTKGIGVEWEDDGCGPTPAKKSRSLLSFFSKNGVVEKPSRCAFFEERKLSSLTSL